MYSHDAICRTLLRHQSDLSLCDSLGHDAHQLAQQAMVKAASVDTEGDNKDENNVKLEKARLTLQVLEIARDHFQNAAELRNSTAFQQQQQQQQQQHEQTENETKSEHDSVQLSNDNNVDSNDNENVNEKKDELPASASSTPSLSKFKKGWKDLKNRAAEVSFLIIINIVSLLNFVFFLKKIKGIEKKESTSKY